MRSYTYRPCASLVPGDVVVDSTRTGDAELVRLVDRVGY